jgi:ketosteroid isomerase-like protein
MSYLTKELLDLERQLWDANVAGDGEFYGKLLRPDALAVSPWGTIDYDTAVAGISVNRNPYTGYELTDEHALALGPDAGLLTYQARVDGQRSDSGESFSHTVYATSVYVREDGRWRSAFHQQTLPA